MMAAAGDDLIGLAIRSVALAIAAGTALVALTLWGVQRLLAGAPASDLPVVSGPAPALLLLGTMGAVCLSGALAWRRLAPVDSYYRRGGLSILSAFGTFLFGTFLMAVLAAPLHYFAGAIGLLALALVAGAAAAALARR
jgi:hypothetical protein